MNKAKGAIYGLSIGDALRYPTELMPFILAGKPAQLANWRNLSL